MYITHIRTHPNLPDLLAQGEDEIYPLLVGNVLEISEFHKIHHVNSKGLKSFFPNHLATSQENYKNMFYLYFI